MARELDLPVVPLCITGTDTLLPPGTLVMRPAAISLRALPAVHPTDFPGPDGHLEMRRRVKEMMAAELAREDREKTT
jgi:1-acyl-sn-glycerol-3-phosphate acyltransferase